MHDNFDPGMLMLLNASLQYVILFCELGEMVTRHYDKVDQILLSCKWYKFPIEIQRILVIAIQNIQQPVVIVGYGNIVCRRETFKKVIV